MKKTKLIFTVAILVNSLWKVQERRAQFHLGLKADTNLSNVYDEYIDLFQKNKSILSFGSYIIPIIHHFG